MLTVRAGVGGALAGVVVLLAAFEAGVGLPLLGWVTGLVCALALTGWMVGAVRASGVERLGAADVVTLGRAMLACGVAALTMTAYVEQQAATTLLAIAVVALALDAVDGRIARRTGSTSAFGARFDGEADAFLMLVLSVYVAGVVGAWVLAIGAVRYVFAAAGWVWPWLRAPLPPRYWRKVVTAVQGVVLTVAAAEILPVWLSGAALVVAAGLLAESFGRDVAWLWRRRHAVERPGRRSRRWRLPAPARGVAAALGVLLVWVALVAPNQAHLLSPAGLVRIPVEGLVLAGLALALPLRAWRVVAVAAGLLLGVLTLVKVLDMAFFAAFDRPFNPVTDAGYLAPAVDLARDTLGPVVAAIAVVAAGLLVVVVLVAMPIAVAGTGRLVTRHRRRAVQAVAALAAVWVVCAAAGVHNGAGAPVASATAGRLAVGQVRAVTTELEDLRRFEASATSKRPAVPTERELLGGLAGKDVLVVFVESYGRVALEGLASSHRLRRLLDAGSTRLQAAGYGSRSGWLDSPTFGGLSWLAHATLQSGLWVDSEARYQLLLSGERMTLSRAFHDAGWRTVALMPSNEDPWTEGQHFYAFDRVYGTQDLDYEGPRFGWSRMPDQFALAGLHRLELEETDRQPVMAKVDLASSHTPWAPLPRLVGWADLGDGSVFARIHQQGASAREIWGDAERVRAAYARSVAYCLRTVLSFVEEHGDDDLVVLLLGDHQPVTLVSGHGGGHEVPVTLLARDPAVLDAIAGWGWVDGLRPDEQAPVWPMDSFRDRFITAFSPLTADAVRPADPAFEVAGPGAPGPDGAGPDGAGPDVVGPGAPREPRR